MTESLGKGYRPWLIAGVAVLVGSLLLLIVSVTIGFVYYSETGQPVWNFVLMVLSVLGIGLGFGSLLLMLLIAAWRSFRGERQARLAPYPAKNEPPV